LTNKKLFVGKLPFKATDKELEELFAQAGTVVSAKIIMDRELDRSKGFGFVEMGSLEEAENAIKMFNGYQWDTQTLVVNEARPEEKRSNGGRPNDRGNRRFDRNNNRSFRDRR
jgi:RNA recognition motif-containing protein